MARVNWRRVWFLCCPFFTVTLTIWCWVIFLFPSQQEITKRYNSQLSSYRNAHYNLTLENRKLKEKYRNLLYETRFISGENYALNKVTDKLSGFLLQQAILEQKSAPIVNSQD